MKTKVLLVAIGILATALVAYSQPHNIKREKERDDPRIQKSVREAKEKKHNKVVLAASGQGAAMVLGIDQALQEHVAVIVTPIGHVAKVDRLGESIYSWYKFTVLESLCRPVPGGVVPEDVPSSLLPVRPGEVLAILPGGVLDVDGVRVEELVTGLPFFEDGKQYLLFLSFLGPRSFADRAFGKLTLGTVGVFSIAEDRLLPAAKGRNPLSVDLRDRFDSSLRVLRSYASANCAHLKHAVNTANGENK
ncbi:MAG TPA: hypothetical protein VN622_01235 [Clostridia bacterium]|nr:hypothetical protein [Clostridia bacterium]